MAHVIYALREPTSAEIRYVGATKGNPFVRLANHIAESTYSTTRRSMWIKELLQAGKTPEVIVLEELADSDTNWRAAEKRWIRRLRSDGAELLNSSPPGGPGRHGFPQRTMRTRRRSCHLHELQIEWLDAEAKRLGITVPALIRRLIDQHRDKGD